VSLTALFAVGLLALITVGGLYFNVSRGFYGETINANAITLYTVVLQ